MRKVGGRMLYVIGFCAVVLTFFLVFVLYNELQIIQELQENNMLLKKLIRDRNKEKDSGSL